MFNLLAKRDAAIVSPIAGTTRDVLQVTLDLAGVKCILQDTAGVRSNDSVTTDVLELEGIKRTRQVTEKADLVVAMVDATEVSKGMEVVQDVLKNQDQIWQPGHAVLVLNKLDLIEDSNGFELVVNGEEGGETDMFGGGTYKISCSNQAGIDKFLDGLSHTVQERIHQGQGTSSIGNAGGGTASTPAVASESSALITRARHRQHVQAAMEALERFDDLSRQGTLAVDMAAEELRLAASELGRITGAVDVEDVLDVLFTDFCIGK